MSGRRRLKYFCTELAQYGLNVPARDYKETGTRFIRTSDINDRGGLINAGEVYIDDSVIESNHRLIEGDLLLSRSGTLGRCLRYQSVIGPATFAGYLIRFRPSPESEPRYLEYCTQALSFQQAIEAEAPASTISNFNAERYANLSIPWWPLDRQRAIADYLDTETNRIDTLITKKRRMIELLVERVGSITFDGITGQLTSSGVCTLPSGISWLGDIPDHFGTPWLGAFHTAQLGKMLNASAASGPDQYRYIKNTNVQWDCFDFEDLPSMTFDADDRRRCELRPGDVLVCEGGEVGRSAVWNQHGKIFFQKALHRVRPLTENVPRFLMYCLWAAANLNVFTVEGNQATIVHLTGEKLRSHRFPWPPLEEQKQIVSLIDTERRHIDQVVTSIERQIELLAERRQALITRAVTRGVNRTEVES